MIGLFVTCILLMNAFLTARYVNSSDILVAGELIAAAIFYLGWNITYYGNKFFGDEKDDYNGRRRY